MSVSTATALTADEAMRQFRALWKPRLAVIAARDGTIFSDAGIEVVPDLVINKKLWAEISKNTQNAIWSYLNSLALLSAATGSDEDDETTFWNDEDFKKGMEEMIKNLKEGVSGSGSDDNPFSAMGGIFEKLREMAGSFAAADGSATTSGAKMPEFKLPERMYRGHIAKMAKEIAGEFKPEDFGISPEMIESDDPAKIFEYLQQIFTKNPELLMNAAKRIGKKIQAKFQRGEIKHDEIIAEIEELMKEFADNEAFSSIFGQMGDVLKFAGRATGHEGSDRRRAVQERLRKKAAEKEAKKAGAGASSASVGGSGSASAAAAAEAAAASLLMEESNTKKKGKK